MQNNIVQFPLTDQNVEDITKVLKENVENSDSLKILTNPPKEYDDKDLEDKQVNTTVQINPTTGEQQVIESKELNTEDNPEENSLEETFTELSNNDNIFSDDFEITEDDIKESLKDSATLGLDKEFNLSDEAILQLLNIVNKVRANENINVYKELPEEIKNMINKYMSQQGIVGFSTQANTARNTISRLLIDEFISNISVNKYTESFNQEVENVFKNVGKEISNLYKEYDKERSSYIEELKSKIPQDSPKRDLVEKVLDAMYDGFKLDRLKEYAKKCRIKKIEYEKPQQRVFYNFENKYNGNTYNIYKPSMVYEILCRHNKIDPKENLKFFLIFCHFCKNYNPSVPEEHAFMYYTLYNIILLDIYKDEAYDDYAPRLLKNINEVINASQKS